MLSARHVMWMLRTVSDMAIMNVGLVFDSVEVKPG